MNTLLKPTNEFVISDIPTIRMQSEHKDITVQALGNIAYDTRQTEIYPPEYPAGLKSFIYVINSKNSKGAESDGYL